MPRTSAHQSRKCGHLARNTGASFLFHLSVALDDFAPEIDLSKARPAEEHHERIVSEEMAKLRGDKIAAE